MFAGSGVYGFAHRMRTRGPRFEDVGRRRTGIAVFVERRTIEHRRILVIVAKDLAFERGAIAVAHPHVIRVRVRRRRDSRRCAICLRSIVYVSNGGGGRCERNCVRMRASSCVGDSVGAGSGVGAASAAASKSAKNMGLAALRRNRRGGPCNDARSIGEATAASSRSKLSHFVPIRAGLQGRLERHAQFERVLHLVLDRCGNVRQHVRGRLRRSARRGFVKSSSRRRRNSARRRSMRTIASFIRSAALP